ncbi:MAG: pyridoxal kinase [Methyloligellaceae bacterium]
MAKILTISSQVVSGHVGNSAMTFALQRMGHEVLSIPTILLSNHPGHKTFAGSATAIPLLQNILNALEANDHLSTLDGVITGYLPSAAHAGFASMALDKIKSSSDARILVDPVMGDYPKGLYIDLPTAEQIKHDLLPKADITTPNYFELQWLTGEQSDPATNAEKLPVKTTLVTSAPGKNEDSLQNLLITPEGIWSCEVPRQQNAPNGTGDLFSALFLGNILNGQNEISALAQATAGIDTVLKASRDSTELQLTRSQEEWVNLGNWPVTKIV